MFIVVFDEETQKLLIDQEFDFLFSEEMDGQLCHYFVHDELKLDFFYLDSSKYLVTDTLFFNERG